LPYIEYWRDRVNPATYSPIDSVILPDSQAAWLRIERRAESIRVSSIRGGTNWQPPEPFDVMLPSRVRVGVLALNNSKTELVIVYSDLKLTQP
jgi:regulation of enolase protein 1 (concanavalin A-like superfamily)